jgi:hypothetical protein
MREIHARVERHFDIEHGSIAGTDGEAIGRRCALAVKQRMNYNGIGACRRFLNPEGFEEGKFLALALASI